MQKKKYNLVLTHSFPTNSIILKGLIEFLSDYFNVYFINLPGFTKKVTPMQNISIEGYAEFLEKEIKNLHLDKYVLGGISFSHCVVSKTDLDNNCRAIIAMEPFVNKSALVVKNKELFLFKTTVKVIKLLRLYSYIWKKQYLNKFLKFSNPEILDIIYREIDPKTFIDTTDLIFSYSDKSWLNKPHILVANKDDKKVSYSKNLKLFRENVNDLLVVNTTVEHFPDFMTKDYFRNHISKKTIDKMMEWLDKRY